MQFESVGRIPSGQLGTPGFLGTVNPWQLRKLSNLAIPFSAWDDSWPDGILTLVIQPLGVEPVGAADE
jgi:hypothetical protein